MTRATCSLPYTTAMTNPFMFGSSFGAWATTPTWSQQWASTKIDEDEGEGVTGENFKLQGIAWYGKYVYLRVSRKSSGTGSWDEAILRVVSSGTSASPTLAVFIDSSMDGSSKGDRGGLSQRTELSPWT